MGTKTEQTSQFACVSAAARRGTSGTMPRRLFTIPSALSLLLCAGTAVAFLGTMKVGFYGPDGPGLYFDTVPWLGWASAAFAVATFALLLRQARRIVTAQTRISQGLCPRCGYDLRATPGRCPECGAASRPGTIPQP